MCDEALWCSCESNKALQGFFIDLETTMAIKSCKQRIATYCFGTQTIQPWASNMYIEWVCPQCAAMLDPRNSHKVESISLTKGGKDAKDRLTALRAKRTTSGS